MAVLTLDGIEEKRCSKCKQLKPLSDFSPDQTHGDSQGRTHCRCKNCKAADARARYQKDALARRLLRQTLDPAPS
jgi:hypothetical protein